MEAAAGFEPAHNGFAVRSLNHLGTPPYLGRTHSYTTASEDDGARPVSITCSRPKSYSTCGLRSHSRSSSCGSAARRPGMTTRGSARARIQQ